MGLCGGFSLSFSSRGEILNLGEGYDCFLSLGEIEDSLEDGVEDERELGVCCRGEVSRDEEVDTECCRGDLLLLLFVGTRGDDTDPACARAGVRVGARGEPVSL